MIDLPTLHIWWMRCLYVAICLVVMFFELLPLNLVPGVVTGPDLILAITFAWAIRQPDYVPGLLVGMVVLLADFILQRPPGLWAALVVVMTESLKRQESTQREPLFTVEWLSIAASIAVMVVIYQIVRLVFIIEPAGWALMMSKSLMTIAVYPAVVLVTHFIFGVRRGGTRDSERQTQI